MYQAPSLRLSSAAERSHKNRSTGIPQKSQSKDIRFAVNTLVLTPFVPFPSCPSRPSGPPAPA